MLSWHTEVVISIANSQQSVKLINEPFNVDFSTELLIYPVPPS